MITKYFNGHNGTGGRDVCPFCGASLVYWQVKGKPMRYSCGVAENSLDRTKKCLERELAKLRKVAEAAVAYHYTGDDPDEACDKYAVLEQRLKEAGYLQ